MPTDRILPETASGWFVKMSNDDRDIRRPYNEFSQLCSRMLPAAGSQLICFFIDSEKYTLAQDEVETAAAMLSRWCERLPCDLRLLSSYSKRTIMTHAILTALPGKVAFFNAPQIPLARTTAGEPFIQLDVPVINIDSCVLADALTRQSRAGYDLFVKPASLLDETVPIPKPNRAFCFTVSNNLKEWKPEPGAKYRQPTKAQMTRGIEITKYVIAEIFTKAITNAETIRLAEDIKSRYLVGVRMRSHLNYPLPLYRGKGLFETKKPASSKHHILVPSQAVQDDIQGQLPGIPILPNSIYSAKICDSIESVWMETGDIIAAWEAGCLRYDTNIRSGLWKPLDARPDLNDTEASTDTRATSYRSKAQNKTQLGHHERVLRNLISETYPEMNFLGFDRNRLRVERGAELACFALSSSPATNPEKIHWIRVYSTKGAEEDREKISANARDPYNRMPMDISIEGKSQENLIYYTPGALVHR
jgi:hypothetical protein